MADTATVHSLARRRAEKEARVNVVKARPVRLSRRMAVGEAFRITLLECLAQIAANAGAVRFSRDVEGLHQMRVGLRRLRAALAAFGDECGSPSLRELRDRTKAFASALGPARDLDVFCEDMLPGPAATSRNDDGFSALGSRAAAARDQAWNRAVACVSGDDFAMFMDDVAAAAERHTHVGGPEKIAATARRVLDEHLVKVMKRGRKARSREVRDFHRLRIGLKKLRYASEFFAPLYDRKDVRRYLRRLKDLQTVLGSLNDTAQVRATLLDLTSDEPASLREHANLQFASGLINGWHRARGKRLGTRALKRLDRFKETKPFWQ